jgi:hypothetical protein
MLRRLGVLCPFYPTAIERVSCCDDRPAPFLLKEETCVRGALVLS